MKKVICITVFLILSGCAGLQTRQETKVAVSELLDQIQIAINEINDNTAGSSLPPFQKAEVTLSTEATKTDSGKASFYLSANGNYKNNNSNSISFVLVPNEDKAMRETSVSGHEIAQYVISTVQAIDQKKI